jgi:hypothetical protein
MALDLDGHAPGADGCDLGAEGRLANAHHPAPLTDAQDGGGTGGIRAHDDSHRLEIVGSRDEEEDEKEHPPTLAHAF